LYPSRGNILDRIACRRYRGVDYLKPGLGGGSLGCMAPWLGWPVEVFLDQAGPFIPLPYTVAAFLPGERQNHLAGLTRMGNDRNIQDRVLDSIYANSDPLDRCKRNVLRRKDIFCPVGQNDPMVGKSALKRDRFDVDSRSPDQHPFIAVKRWIAHNTTLLCSVVVVSPYTGKRYL
jgi:hypothetical protein